MHTQLPRRFADWRIAFGEIRHRRLRPVGHAFRYRGFFLRVPAHQLDGRAAGNPLFGVNRWALLSFQERDHGVGGAALPWIRGLLQEAGVDADGEIWLHAFPRVLGYAFKPVSFWFCHDRQGACRAVLAEVIDACLAHPDLYPGIAAVDQAARSASREQDGTQA